MKVLELLEEIEDIADTSTRIPLNGKIALNKEELMEIVKDIKIALPDEIQQANFIKNERQRILDEAKNEYEIILSDAEKQAKLLVEEHEITTQAKKRADKLLFKTEEHIKMLKMESFEYIYNILDDFQGKIDLLNNQYLGDMFNDLQRSFSVINDKLIENRNEIKELSFSIIENSNDGGE